MEKIYKELNHDGFVIRERASASMLMGALGYLCYVKLDLRNQSLDPRQHPGASAPEQVDEDTA